MASRAVQMIGQHKFSLLLGTVPQYGPKIQVIQRPGLNDFIRRNSGFSSPAFQLQSTLELQYKWQASELIAAYNLLCSAEPQKLIKDDYDYEQGQGLRVAVLEVRPIRNREMALICGGINDGANPPANRELVCRWSLKFVKVVT